MNRLGTFVQFGKANTPPDTDKNDNALLHPSSNTFDKIIDLSSSVVLPGFHKIHIHVSYLGELSLWMVVSECHSVTDLTKLLKRESDLTRIDGPPSP